MAPEASERRLAAILSADVVGYSRLMAEDEHATIRTLNAYRDLIASLVGDHHGRVVDATGDNLLAEFPNALDAVQCAVEIQGVLRVRNQSLSEGRRMLFRIGVHLGDITVEGDRLYGDGVNIAARLEGLAESGGICISGEVHSQVRSRLGLDFEDLSELPVKNIPEPVHVYRVRTEPAGPATATSSLRIRHGLVAAGLVVALAAAGLAGWRMFPSGRTEPKAAVDSAPIRSIAVLPLENISGDPEQEYFADGMTEALITSLAKVEALRVISRTSVMQYKRARKPLPEIARELGVDAVVEGSVLRAGNRVRITAQLIHATTDEHLWTESYDRDLGDTLALQSEVARDPVGARIFLALSHLRHGRPEDAVAVLRPAVELTGRNEPLLGFLGAALAEAGEVEEARALLDELITRARDRYIEPNTVALIYAALGEDVAAFEWFERAYEEHSQMLIMAPALRGPTYPLRSDPRFVDLMHRVGLPG